MKIEEAKVILAKECERAIATKCFRTYDQPVSDDYAINIWGYYNNFEEIMFAEYKTCEQVLAEAIEHVRKYESEDLKNSSPTIIRPCPYTGKNCDTAPANGACRCSVADYYNY